MSEKHTIRRSLDQTRTLGDLTALRAMTDEDIQRGIDSDPDAAPIADAAWFAAARRVEPVTKVAISLRVDRDVLDFFRSLGPGHLTRMNGVLRAFMEHEKKRA